MTIDASLESWSQVNASQDSYWVGQSLDWSSRPLDVFLSVELPFWLFVPDYSVDVTISRHPFPVQIRSDYFQVFGNEVTDSKSSCLYLGPKPLPARYGSELDELIRQRKVTTLSRKCKTVVRVSAKCISDVLAAMEEDTRRQQEAHYYLRALCAGHIPIINTIIQHYRLATYDLFAHEVSPWDIPVWFADHGRHFTRVTLLDYADWDWKPRHFFSDEAPKTHQLIDTDRLNSELSSVPQPGEIELLDAMGNMERDNYSGAVRRIATAIEVILESVLREEMMKREPLATVEARLVESRGDFSGHLSQYEKLAGRDLPQELKAELTATRNLRRAIVRDVHRITHADRGKAQRAVDTGRWIFNWLESLPDRLSVREHPQSVVMRSLGGYALANIFNSRISPNGVVVMRPDFDHVGNEVG